MGASSCLAKVLGIPRKGPARSGRRRGRRGRSPCREHHHMPTVSRAGAKSAPSADCSRICAKPKDLRGKPRWGLRRTLGGGRPLMDLACLSVGRISKSPSTSIWGRGQNNAALDVSPCGIGALLEWTGSAFEVSCSRSRHHHHRDRPRRPPRRRERERRLRSPCRPWSSLDARACRARRERPSRKPWWTEQQAKGQLREPFVRTLGQ